MSDIVSEICKCLLENNGEMEDVIANAAFCIENFKGLPDDSWPEEIRSIQVTDTQAKFIKETLMRYAEDNLGSELLGSIIWAFGKAATNEDIPFLDFILQDVVERDSNALYQTLCVLSNVGVKVFSSGRNSVLNVENNNALAKQYLDA